MSDHGYEPSAEEIRADIEQTRERLGETVEALGAHLNPSLLKQRVKDSVHEATIGRVKTMASNARDKAEESGRGLIASLRENPIPAAMIAGGIGWLLFSKRRDRAENRQLRLADVEEFDYTGDGSMEYESDVSASAYSGRSVDLTRQSTGVEREGVKDKVRESVDAATHRVGDTARNVGSRVTETARSASERVASGASTAAHVVADRARATTERVERTFDENPMMLGAVAAAVGLAVGMSLPASERESRLVGARRDELMDKAREAISDTTEKVKSAAERVVPEVKETLKEVAREEGLAG